MNLAFPALIVFLLVLPGFLARRAYQQAEKTQIDAAPFGVAITQAFFWALALDLAWSALVHTLVARIDFDALFTLVIGDRSPSTHVEAALRSLALDPWRPLAFFLSLYVFSVLAGRGGRALVRALGLDRQEWQFLGFTSPFRFATPWYYLFTAYDRTPKPEGVVVAGVVDISGKAYLYAGFLANYFLNDDGSLDRMILKYAIRRPMDADIDATADAPDRFYDIDGDYLVLRYDELKTLNVKYVDDVSATALEAEGDAAAHAVDDTQAE